MVKNKKIENKINHYSQVVMMHLNKRILYAVLILIAFCLGFWLRSIIKLTSTNTFLSADNTLREHGKYKLVSPLLTCGNSENKSFSQFDDLQKKVNSVVQKALSQNLASTISVYFRDYQSNGKWFGINENDKYDPASLLKVPLMIAYFKEAENNPGILSAELTYDGSIDNNNQVFRSKYYIVPGTYKIEDLIKAMIVNSDNNATQLLYDNIDKKSLNEVFTDMGVPLIQNTEESFDLISAKMYSYFFRVLYNATYLTPEHSEKALEILSADNFDQGIRGTIPQTISVAQKFGERTVFDLNGEALSRELHDCGIIYYPNDPYLLCVMTKGTDFKNLATIIQNISQTIYSEMPSLLSNTKAI